MCLPWGLAHRRCSMNHCRAKMSEAHAPEALSVPWPDSASPTVGAQPCSLNTVRVVTDARKCLGPWDSRGPHRLLLKAGLFAMGSASSWCQLSHTAGSEAKQRFLFKSKVPTGIERKPAQPRGLSLSACPLVASLPSFPGPSSLWPVAWFLVPYCPASFSMGHTSHAMCLQGLG